MTTRSRPLASLALFAALCVGNPALAQQAPGADEYTRSVRAGLERLVGGDARGAMTELRRAMELDGARPEAPFQLAAAQRLSGELEDALGTFRQAAALAEAAHQTRWRARALSAVAFTLERMAGRMPEARAAWMEYVRFAESNPGVVDPLIGRARVQAIDIVTEQEEAYVEVRRRIAEREEERRREAQEARPRR